jgi:hypothetical protein
MSNVYLLDPSSSLSTQILTNGKASIGSTNFNPISSPYTLNVQGTACSNNVSAFQIPADTSNNRPAGQAGYIRYNTDTNVIEYFSTLTNSWLPISSQPPLITNVTPSYVSEDSSLNSYTITGNYFNTGSAVSFIGVNNGVTYTTQTGTGYINTTTLTATATYAMSDASINVGGFTLKVTNTDSGLSATYGTPLTFNTGPSWSTAPNTNLGTSFYDQSFTIVTTPYAAIVATDIHTPVTYYYQTASAGAPLVLLDASSGKLKGTNPSFTTTVSTTYIFSAIALDSLTPPAASDSRSFAFTVTLPIATIVGGTSIVGYTDSAGNNFSLTTPYANGYTVYIFTAGTSTFTTTSYFPTYISYLAIGGGGAGGAGDAAGSGGGGGGAGGYRTGYTPITAGTSYTITVGTGGTGVVGGTGNNGSSTSISGTGISITSAGGGGGGNTTGVPGNGVGAAGASGGGGGLRNNAAGGAGNTPSTTPSQGNAGGAALFGNTGATGRGGGGGSALARGSGGYGNSELNANYAVGPGGTGGSGLANNIRGTGSVVYSGGGGAGSYDRLIGGGGSGGGGSGSGLGNSSSSFSVVGTAGTVNTGGGGGGSATGVSVGAIAGGAGGSGIVILRHLSSVISSTIPSAFTINGVTYSGTSLNGIYRTASGYSTGTNTTPGTATVTYVDSTGANPRAFSLGAWPGGYTIVTFTTTTPTTGYTWNGTTGTYLATPNQVSYYGNTSDFSFNAISPFPAQIEYLIVAGGGTGAKGTGGETYGGGGGAGQVLAGTISITAGTTYTVKVGSGAVMDPNGASGFAVPGGDTVYYNLTKDGVSSSSFGLTSSGGGGGNGGTNIGTTWNPAATSGVGGTSGNGFLGGLNAPNGANGTNPAGGGGGASDFGRPPSVSWTNSGGYGIASQISGTYTGYGGGGGGGGDSGTNFAGGTTPAGVTIGGTGGTSSGTTNPTAGAPDTGSGGGGMRADDVGAGGGGGT